MINDTLLLTYFNISLINSKSYFALSEVKNLSLQIFSYLEPQIYCHMTAFQNLQTYKLWVSVTYISCHQPCIYVGPFGLSSYVRI